MSKTLKVIKYIAINIALALGVYGAFVMKVNGIENIMLFVVWVQFFVSFFLFSAQMREEVFKNKLLIPEWISGPIDLTFTLAFVWFGHIFTAIAYMLGRAFYAFALNEYKKSKSNKVKIPPLYSAPNRN